ncbi:MAG TPA: hypothetical protein VFM54_05725 [Micromonosporaceae bacterium]|nr:hypothetical protein [Micromonosporaceae bacterium]
MARLLSLVVLAALGYLVAWLAGLDDLDQSISYRYGTAVLLGVGLYASTYGIDLRELHGHRRLVGLAVTVGVLVKAALIGVSLALAFRDPLFLILGVAVAQIDPLSVAALVGDPRMSPRAKSILGAWSSFDDPVTAILVIYAAAVATTSFGLGDRGGLGSVGTPGGGLRAYAFDIGANLAFAGLAYLLWRLLRTHQAVALAGLVVLFAVGVSLFLMLGLAIAGLFYRPRSSWVASRPEAGQVAAGGPEAGQVAAGGAAGDQVAAGRPWLDRVVGAVTQGALGVAAVLLGMLLVAGVDLRHGAALGAAAFAAQVVVGWLLTRGLPRMDRVHLAFAQQNGITAIILALRLEADYSGVVAVVAPAILVTNTIFVVVNAAVDRRVLARPASPGAGQPQGGEL